MDNRIEFADALRAFAALSIVFLHVSSPIAQHPASYPAGWWWTANIAYSLARPSIALFVMVSGLLLLSPSKEESMTRFFKKRFIRIVVPFVFWGTVYFFWKTRGRVSAQALGGLARQFVEGPVYYHLWFIYTIVGIYLATPVFRVYVKHASRSNYAYLLCLWFAGTCLYPLVRHFWGLSIGIPVMVAGGFLGAFLLGDFLRGARPGKRAVAWLAALAVLCLAATTVAGYLLSSGPRKEYDAVFQEFLSPTVVAAAACIFLVCKSIPFDSARRAAPRLYGAVTMISGASFSVYLMHILVLEILKSHIPGFALDATFMHPLLGIPLTVTVTLIVCVGVTVVMRRVPGGRFVFP
jgi:surface polysaccharide O-acyltransferase-like enzyme